MSHVQHNVICFTCFEKEKTVECRHRLIEIGLDVTDISVSSVNEYFTFFTVPSGSKAGWPPAEEHMRKIEMAKEVIKSYDYDDGSSSIDFKWVTYGEHNG